MWLHNKGKRARSVKIGGRGSAQRKKEESHNKGILFLEQEESHTPGLPGSIRSVWEICSLVSSRLATEWELWELGQYQGLLTTGAYKQEAKEAPETGPKKDSRVYVLAVFGYLSMKINVVPPGSPPEQGGDLEADSFHFLFPCTLAGKKTVRAQLYHLKVRSEKAPCHALDLTDLGCV